MARETSSPDELQFHYSRAERLGRDEQASDEKRSGLFGRLFTRNRSLLIVILDVLLLLLMFILLQFVFRPGMATKRVEGYRFTITAFVFDSEVYAAVEAVARSDRDASSGESTLVTLRFPDGSEVTDVLPARAGESIVVRSVFANAGDDDSPRVVVDVEALGRSFSLATAAGGQ